LARRLGRISKCVFGVGPDGAAAVFTGALCGFPIGASIVRDLREAGCVGDDESALLIPLADNASPAFVVGVVGGIYGAPFGFFLFAWQLAAAFITGVLFSRRLKRTDKPETRTYTGIKREPLVRALSSSIKSAAASMISVVSCVVFFSLTAEMLSGAASLLLNPTVADVLLRSVFEFSGAPAAAAALTGWIPAAATGFAVGWGSLSVAAQAAALSGTDSMKLWFPFKLTQGALTAAGAVLYEAFIGMPDASAAAGAFYAPFDTRRFFAAGAAILSAVFAVCVSLIMKRRKA
jgi:hypothetical protein